MTEFNYTVTEKDRELSVKELLRRNFHFSSRLLTKIKQQDLAKLNGEPVRGWMVAHPGDKLTVNLPEETSDFRRKIYLSRWSLRIKTFSSSINSPAT